MSSSSELSSSIANKLARNPDFFLVFVPGRAVACEEWRCWPGFLPSRFLPVVFLPLGRRGEVSSSGFCELRLEELDPSLLLVFEPLETGRGGRSFLGEAFTASSLDSCAERGSVFCTRSEPASFVAPLEGVGFELRRTTTVRLVVGGACSAPSPRLLSSPCMVLYGDHGVDLGTEAATSRAGQERGLLHCCKGAP